jgi:uncharacterized protein (DUF1330 family)
MTIISRAHRLAASVLCYGGTARLTDAPCRFGGLDPKRLAVPTASHRLVRDAGPWRRRTVSDQPESAMPAYWVARSKINDPVEYKKYTDRVPAILAKYGGKVLARGGKFQIMEGPDKFHRFVVIEFPTFEQGVACFTSKEYDEAAAFRRSGAGEVETIMVEGGEATPR